MFEPVQTATTLEETVERLGTAIRLGLLGPGDRLPPERELADQLGIARSTLRQALTSLTESGHLVALRGRGGGTFVSDAPPLAEGSRVQLSEGHWRELLDFRTAVEVGAAVLAAERARHADLMPLYGHVEAIAAGLGLSAGDAIGVAYAGAGSAMAASPGSAAAEASADDSRCTRPPSTRTANRFLPAIRCRCFNRRAITAASR